MGLKAPEPQTSKEFVDVYLDSADVSQWALPPGCPPVVGVTTNPSLVFQVGLRVNLDTEAPKVAMQRPCPAKKAALSEMSDPFQG